MSKNLQNIGLVSALTLVSRVLGLVRESATAAVFGTSGLISAFLTGVTLPNLFRRLLAEGGLTAAYVPTLHHELETKRRDGAFALVNQVASWLALVTGTLVLAAMLLFSQRWAIAAVGVRVGAEAETLERWQDAAHFTVILFPYLLCVSLSAVFSATLQSFQRFLEPALSPIWLNVAIIGLLGGSVLVAAGDPAVQVYWLAAGWLLGGVLQMAVPAWALRRQGWTPRVDFGVSPPLRAMVRLMVPTLFSSSIYLVNMSTSRLIGLSLNDQAVSVLNYAQRLMELPIGVFAVAVATVVFPLISRHAAAGEHDKLAEAYRKGMRLILLINVPAAVGLCVLAEPIVRVILQYGAFGSADTALMTPVLLANAVGLPFLSFASLALRAFYAHKDTRTPVNAALLSLVVNIGLSLALMGPLAEVGLALAGSAAAAAQAAYLQWHLARKQAGLAFGVLAADLVKIIAAAAVMGAAVWGGWQAWSTVLPATKLTAALGLGIFIAAGAGVYGLLVWLMRVEGRDELAAMLGKVRGRLGRRV